jgi:hypothetical protein
MLSVLRWIEQSIPVEDRWYLVFRRYVDQSAGRVRDMGGNPDLVKADPDGRWEKVVTGRGDRDRDRDRDRGESHEDRDRDEHRREAEELVGFTGKVSGIVYDRFGDFVGFRLDTEDGERHFHSREHELEALVQRAWMERILTTVLAERHEADRPMKLVLRGGAPSFDH